MKAAPCQLAEFVLVKVGKGTLCLMRIALEAARQQMMLWIAMSSPVQVKRLKLIIVCDLFCLVLVSNIRLRQFNYSLQEVIVINV